MSPNIDRDEVLEEMTRRYKQAIPPGYKDASKPDGGIGDFLIWKTILNLGEKNNWKNLLDPKIEKKLKKVFHEEMKELGYI